MEITALCMVVASLKVVPDKSQFFKYESVSLSCEQQGNATGWRVNRTTSVTRISSGCNTDWGQINQSQCFIDDPYQSDTGVYWCESGSGECSDAVNITVTDGDVILESPVLPVMEGGAVTLRCTTKTTPSNLPADFYKDGVLIRTSYIGEMTIHSVSRSDEGLYKCSISDSGESPESWLAVRAAPWTPTHFPSSYIVLPVVGFSLLLAFSLLLYVWKTHKGRGDADPETVTYSDISIIQGAQPKRETDNTDTPRAPPETFYSTVKPVFFICSNKLLEQGRNKI